MVFVRELCRTGAGRESVMPVLAEIGAAKFCSNGVLFGEISVPGRAVVLNV